MAIDNGTDVTWWAVASAFGGVIIGSVLGGLISFWLQRKSLAATKALHDADRREVRKALGYALLFKMIRLCSDLVQLGKPIRERVAAAGLDPAQYSGHSLRAGLATSAAQAGVPTWRIRAQTRHASDAMLARYIRDGEMFTDNAAGALL